MASGGYQFSNSSIHTIQWRRFGAPSINYAGKVVALPQLVHCFLVRDAASQCPVSVLPSVGRRGGSVPRPGRGPFSIPERSGHVFVNDSLNFGRIKALAHR